MERGREQLSGRIWRRVRVLLLLDGGQGVRAMALAVGGCPREISRVRKRYLKAGLEHALTEDPRPKPERKLDSTQEAAVVALVCGPPPEGRARWTVRLLAQEASRRGIVEPVGRETIRVVLARQDLKPWREKNVVRPANRSGVRRQDGGRAAAQGRTHLRSSLRAEHTSRPPRASSAGPGQGSSRGSSWPAGGSGPVLPTRPPSRRSGPGARYLPRLMDLIWSRKIDPGKVFDLTLPLAEVAE
jgi:hypothetical protein